ncbi:anti-sigma factor family protein [Stakelama marina]|uniref:Anti-sigma factor n=1 Tax=Stakelama marina TaxID=2826939 RepID=A0A8T4IBV6_9SPHN|nr:anti-sigma factor [Stakelama marina]MBR0552508.1 anti-sigma factor [Stakelama marina]
MIAPETLMAYVDGELPPLEAKRVERAIAADPALAEQVQRERRLREQLNARFDTVAAEPVPDALADMVRGADTVVSLDERRERRRPFGGHWYRNAAAIAATLALGVIAGHTLRIGGGSAGGFAMHDGRLIASGQVAHALDTQLASSQPHDATTRMLVSFRAKDGSYCRVFEMARQGGIACNDKGDWQVRQLRGVAGESAADYRQAGSSAGALMADAQDMMAGAPLDAAQEKAAADRNWRAR